MKEQTAVRPDLFVRTHLYLLDNVYPIAFKATLFTIKLPIHSSRY